jgi:hypothetical protein
MENETGGQLAARSRIPDLTLFDSLDGVQYLATTTPGVNL